MERARADLQEGGSGLDLKSPGRWDIYNSEGIHLQDGSSQRAWPLVLLPWWVKRPHSLLISAPGSWLLQDAVDWNDQHFSQLFNSAAMLPSVFHKLLFPVFGFPETFASILQLMMIHIALHTS